MKWIFMTDVGLSVDINSSDGSRTISNWSELPYQNFVFELSFVMAVLCRNTSDSSPFTNTKVWSVWAAADKKNTTLPLLWRLPTCFFNSLVLSSLYSYSRPPSYYPYPMYWQWFQSSDVMNKMLSNNHWWYFFPHHGNIGWMKLEPLSY